MPGPKPNPQMAKCHPDKPHNARGLCHACYRRWWLGQDQDRRTRASATTTKWAKSDAGVAYRKTAWASRTEDQVRSSKDGQLRRKYGLTLSHVEQMLAAQDHACQHCSRPVSLFAKDKASSASVDHCHDTGRVRGILCHPCNTSLGQLGDTVEALERALAYLKGTQTK